MKINIAKLELLMVKRGMNFGQLASKADISRQTLSTIRGRRSCAASTAIKLATALDVEATTFIETKED